MPTTNGIEYEIRLNQIRQGVITGEDGLEWFAGLEGTEQKSVLCTLNYMCMQAGPMTADVPLAILDAGLKPTFTPCVMLKSGKIRTASSKALHLPSTEYLKLFRLLIALFKIADQRRAELCVPDCRHWWHQDLASEAVLLTIRENYHNGNL